MTLRLLHDTKRWLWCFLALYAGPVWSPVGSVTVRTPPKNPSTIEAQAKFFQDFFSVQLSPYKIEFGHVCEDPNTWEQRYEKKDFKNHRDMGKVRWGDKQGGYGEHYWDLNHAGHAGNHDHDGYDSDSDDGSYHHDRDNTHETHDAYEEPTENSPNYENDEYDPEKSSHYEENGRAKRRAHQRFKVERKPLKEELYEEEVPTQHVTQKQTRKVKEQLQTAPSHNVEKVTETEEDLDEVIYKKPAKQKRTQQRVVQKDHDDEEDYKLAREHNKQHQSRLEVSDVQEQPSQYVTRTQTEPAHYVPYENGAGVRQHRTPQVSTAASAPRLFLEPSTGHVVDRATGQAYVLQPVVANNNYN